MTRVGDTSPHPPGSCKFCGVPNARPHKDACPWRRNVIVGPEDCVQLGGTPTLVLDGDEPSQARLALFLYSLLRNGTPGEVERAAVEAEGAGLTPEVVEVSNPFLFTYAENLAGRLIHGSKAIETAREVMEAFVMDDDERVALTDAEKSVLTIKAENWLEEFGPKPLKAEEIG
jgi:hypothetical protein